jgi:hypothetical protein
MKKLILITLCLPLLTFGQNAFTERSVKSNTITPKSFEYETIDGFNKTSNLPFSPIEWTASQSLKGNLIKYRLKYDDNFGLPIWLDVINPETKKGFGVDVETEQNTLTAVYADLPGLFSWNQDGGLTLKSSTTDELGYTHVRYIQTYKDIPVNGAVWTISANNTAATTFSHVSSSNNTFSDKSAVSAHCNGGLAFNYFKATHNRNSINGSGGTIISVVNVADSETGGSMENAYWNGQAMFYGNGGSAFTPLAGALDVAGHELTHGVVSNSANLEYEGQSGAINESMADVFGAMIDRDDWKMGEDLENSIAIYPNPVNNMVHVKSSKYKLNGIQVFGLNGQELMSASSNSIRVDDLEAGIYFIRINTSQGSIIKRFSKL